jgi:UDP-2,3-diacylglucosamine pyrophosphatase LpxH
VREVGGELPKTVVISDPHFGYSGFNKPEFDNFLDYLKGGGKVSRLVLLGDIFDLWRVDATEAVSFGYNYIEKLREVCNDIYYLAGNHDYHSRESWRVRDLARFLGMTPYYPYLVLDENVFLTHGDYFDIYEIKIAEIAIYAVYEAIYHMDKSLVGSLEDYFWNPVALLRKWLQLYGRSAAKAKAEPPAQYLSTMLNLSSRAEVKKLDEGLDYLAENPKVAVQMFVPTTMRADLGTELPRLMTRKKMRGIDTAPVRSLLSKNLVELARKISGRPGIEKIIYGHTHKAENNPSKGYWNTGSWVEGESTFCEIEDGQINVYRLKNGQKTVV